MINIYDQNAESFDNNGLATLNPISAELSVDINGAWALNMTLPYDADKKYLYVEKSSIIQCDVSILREHTSNKQLFRVYDVKKNLSSISVIAFPIGMEAIYDAPIEELNIPGEAGVATASGIDAAGVLHNYVRDHGNNKYTVSSNVTAQSYSQWNNTNLIAAISGSDDNSFINKWGGEVVYDNFAIMIRNKIGQNNNPYRVAYGRNLTGLEHDTDMSGVITRVFPLSKDDLRLNTYSDTEYPSGQTYIDSSQTGNPYIRSAFIMSPYELTDTNSDSNSITAINTRVWQTAIYTTILNTAETLWNGILDDVQTYCAEYIKDIAQDIVEYTQARYVYTHKGWQSIIKALIKSGIEWIGKAAIADMSWIGVNGYIYGDFDSDGNFKNYPKGQYLYVYSESKWYYFEDDGLMSEDEIPQETIDLLNTYDWHTDSTGTYYGDTEPRMFSCWIENSDQTHSWVNAQGYYEAQWDDSTTWDWTNIDGWRYGRSATQYVKSCYVEIDKNLEYFGADGFWRDWMRVPAEDMGWYQTKEGANAGKWWYGSLNRYYAHNEFVYVTVDGTMEEWWYDKEGWYDADSSGESDYGWHGDSSTGIWFGEEDAGTGDKNKYIHDKWAYIDGTYYWFDSDGYISGDRSKAKQDWAWGDQVDEVTGKHWFGNTDESFNRMWLESQYMKINNEWYFFDSDGYMIDRGTKKSQTISWFSNAIVAVLTPLAKEYLKQAYDLLYDQMTAWVEKQYSEGLDVPSITVTVDLVDLSKTSEYADYADLEKIYLGDSVLCKDVVHDIQIEARVVGLTYDVIRGYNTKVTIGQLGKDLSQILGVNYKGSGDSDTTLIAGDGIHKDGNVISVDDGNNGTSYGIQDVTYEGASLVSGNVAVLDEVITEVEANPSGEAGAELTKLRVGNNVYSIPEGSGGLQYWTETEQSFYRVGNHSQESADEAYLKPRNHEIGMYQRGNGWSNPNVIRIDASTDNIVVGKAGSDRRWIAIFASLSPLTTFQWGAGTNGMSPPYGVQEWFDGESYPSSSRYPTSWYTGSCEYEGNTWYILMVDAYYWESGSGSGCDGIQSIGHSYTNVPETGGLALLQTAHATATVSATTSIGVGNYPFSYTKEGQLLAYVDGKGNGVFQEIETEDGTLTEQMALKQDKLTAGQNITIGADGKTISATNTDEVSELTDVELTNLADGQVLKWDSTAEKWVNDDESGGSEVIANPSGTATDTLSKVSIDGTVYEIEGSSGEGYTEDVLWNTGGTTSSWASPLVVTLSSNISDYDEIRVSFTDVDGNDGFVFIPTSEIPSNYADKYFVGAGDFLATVKVNSDTQISCYAKNGITMTYNNVIGISYGSGGSGGGGGGGNTITYGTTNPTLNARDGDIYYLLRRDGKKKGLFLYETNQWVLIEGMARQDGYVVVGENKNNTDGNASATLVVDSEIVDDGATISNFVLDLRALFYSGSTHYSSSTTFTNYVDYTKSLTYSWTTQSGSTKQWFDICYISDTNNIHVLSDWTTYTEGGTYTFNIPTEAQSLTANDFKIDFKNVLSGGLSKSTANVTKSISNGVLSVTLPDICRGIDLRIVYGM